MRKLKLNRKQEAVGHKSIKNEGKGREAALRVSELGGTLLSYMMDFGTYVEGPLADKLDSAYEALNDLVNDIDIDID